MNTLLSALPENLSSLVSRRFIAAKDAGHLIFSKTQVTTIVASDIAYQLRFCPSLAKKPGAGDAKAAGGDTSTTHNNQQQQQQSQQKKKPDPFHNPPPDLLIAEFSTVRGAAAAAAAAAGTNGGGSNLDSAIPAPITHILVLNKFPVIANHFILATKDFKRQTDLLDKEDLVATFACLRAWVNDSSSSSSSSSSNGPGQQARDGGGDGNVNENTRHRSRRLFAFFNSGDASGASQPHRHIQFLPVEDMAIATAATATSTSTAGGRRDEGEGNVELGKDAWTPLIDRFSTPGSGSGAGASSSSPGTEQRGDHHLKTEGTRSSTDGNLKRIPQLPFVHFARALPPSPSEEVLYETYLALYRAAVEAAKRSDPRHHHGGDDNDGEGCLLSSINDGNNQAAAAGEGTPAAISYNLAMTESTMMICPRRSESATIPLSVAPDQIDAANAGSVALNGTILAGTLMVKIEEEWNQLRGNPELLTEVLRTVGIPAS